ncbi:hypothetical protein [Plantactinospora sp. KLBMP9567]|uniref:hypothetical protein n=1 Tax=Plantactinospora sp. KLBMP9567 TaxID=3085900 RepID=UPI0029823FBC|nr:hypothetical protein [Plantactinospora sp. KLBMP9567]MDW5330310.1 hypothetical protein [Plantactinospora sp. KLBMP9567]
MPLPLPSDADLPDGPHRALVVDLHHLYRRAGYPGLKKISNEIRDRDDLPDAVSHETISKILQGEVLPRWSKLESLVRVLAAWSVDRPIADTEARRFQELWHAAGGLPVGEVTISSLKSIDEPLMGPAVATGDEHDLIVEHEDARLSFDSGLYRCAIRRLLYNGTDEPVTRFPIEIRVDRHPKNAEFSNRYHRDHPLTWDELELVASCGGEPMRWAAFTDRDALKEVWLLFENEQGHFPLYPGQRTVLTYGWTVGDDKWGRWFQRAIRRPTLRLTVGIDFPADLRPTAWGTRSSLWNDDILQTPIQEELVDGRSVFSWQTDRVLLQDRYTIEWRFRSDARSPGGR